MDEEIESKEAGDLAMDGWKPFGSESYAHSPLALPSLMCARGLS